MKDVLTVDNAPAYAVKIERIGKMDFEVTYPELAYIRQLLQKDSPKKSSIDEDIRIDLLDKLQGLEEDCAAGLIS